jgi:sterol desaturase/sphingolipid hydroxylase (fatty acid hydroxylase superfamily)
MDGVASPGALFSAALLVLAGICELARPRRPSGEQTAQRWIGNAGLFVLSFGLGYLIAPLVAALVATGGIRLGLLDDVASPALRLVVAIVSLDLLDYALHRASHRIGPLWRIHAVHHSDTELDVTTTLRHHPVEAAVSSLVIGGGGALLGFSPGEIASYGLLALGVQLVAHANFALPAPLERLLAPVLVTPDFHRVHHSRRRPETDANFAQAFSIWDRVFGTYRLRPEPEIDFGLDEFRETAAQRLDRLLLQPIMARSPTAAALRN